VTTLRAYEERTESFQAKLPDAYRFQLFLSFIGQHTPVTSSTIARWLKGFMEEAGIDISIFKAHSVREHRALLQLEWELLPRIL